MREMHVAKSAGYAGDSEDRWANFRVSERFGVQAFTGTLVRMGDKFIRIQNLVANPANEQVGENLKDTLMDLASYSLIALCISKENGKKLVAKKGQQGDPAYMRQLDNMTKTPVSKASWKVSQGCIEEIFNDLAKSHDTRDERTEFYLFNLAYWSLIGICALEKID